MNRFDITDYNDAFENFAKTVLTEAEITYACYVTDISVPRKFRSLASTIRPRYRKPLFEHRMCSIGSISIILGAHAHIPVLSDKNKSNAAYIL